MILYDHREQRSGVPALLTLAGHEVQAHQLPVGDYVLSERLVVERKRAEDLVSSITSGRLFEQLQRMSESFERRVLLVEGLPERFPAAGWKGALASALTSGASVLQVADSEEAAEWIGRLASREGRERRALRPRGSARKPLDPDRLAEHVLAGLPGVSAVGARQLLAHFGSLQAVFAADEQQLRQVRGIGRKRSTALAGTFHRLYGSSPLSSGS